MKATVTSRLVETSIDCSMRPTQPMPAMTAILAAYDGVILCPAERLTQRPTCGRLHPGAALVGAALERVPHWPLVTDLGQGWMGAGWLRCSFRRLGMRLMQLLSWAG